MAPNYILIATDDVFKFREGEDWVRREIEVAIEEYESDPTERTITVLVPETVYFPEKETLSESIRNKKAIKKLYKHANRSINYREMNRHIIAVVC